MALPNFFVGIDALNCLLQTDFDEPKKDIDLTLDLIELPFWFSFRSNKKKQTLKVFTQTDLYTKDEKMAVEKGSLVLNRASDQVSIKAVQEISESMKIFYVACQKLSCLIQEKGLKSLYANLDPEKAGILLTEKNGKLHWKVVSGKERPNLTVQTLFGQITIGRPYMDDLLERSELDDLSLEDKIASAEEGNTTAMEQLAMLYLNGDEVQKVKPDPAKGVYWFTKLAETGDANAMFNLGLHYAKGHGVKRNFAKAAQWMEKAAKAGDDDAPTLIEEYRKLARALKRAEKGDAQAQADLAEGLMRLGGSVNLAGSDDDYAESVKWAKLAADQGNADAMWVLALAYRHGRGMNQNIDTALKYYKQGAELGNAACQYGLGCYYTKGDYLKKDNKKAFELFRKAAVQGHGLAMKELGRCYEYGNGCKGNMKTALEWYTKASRVLDDPELDRRVMALQSLAEIDPSWEEDYPGKDQEGDFSDGVFDASRIMKKNLEAAGKDAGDEALANMSVEEAYDAFFGNFDEESNRNKQSRHHNQSSKTDSKKEKKKKTKPKDKSRPPTSSRNKKSDSGTVEKPKQEKVDDEDIYLDVDENMSKEEQVRFAQSKYRKARHEQAVRRLQTRGQEANSEPAGNSNKESKADVKRKIMEARNEALKKTKRNTEDSPAMKQYREDYEEWKRLKKEAEDERTALIEERLRQEKINRETAAKKEYETKISEANHHAEECRDAKSKAETTLASLGFFSFSKKRFQQDIIKNMAAELVKAEQELKQAEYNYNKAMESIPAQVAALRKKIESEVKASVPMPKRPVKPKS